MTIKTYTELSKLQTFEERFAYLQLGGTVGHETFGFDRYLNQLLYRHSRRWKEARRQVIIRDNGCDLGVEGYEIFGQRIIVHHMNPITLDDILQERDWIFDPEYLICTVHDTHNAIHYGDISLLVGPPVERTKNDTCPWRHYGGNRMDEQESILISIKKLLGIEAFYEAFDTDVIIHINSVFMILTQLGYGPPEGFFIRDNSAVWTDYITEENNIESIKTYMFMKVKLIFDPPSSSAVIEAYKQFINEFEWRINVAAESTKS